MGPRSWETANERYATWHLSCGTCWDGAWKGRRNSYTRGAKMAQVSIGRIAWTSCSPAIRKGDMKMESMRASQRTENHSNVRLFIAGVLAMWFALVFFLGARESFVRAPGAWPLPILIGVTAPLLVFLVA